MRRLVLALAVLATLGLAVATPAGAITNGTVDGAAHPNVGGLVADQAYSDGTWIYCSGTLISPTVFLTAAHCVTSSYTPPGSQWYVSFAPDLYAKGIKVITADAYYYDPLYGHDQANLHDMAVIILPANSTRGLTPYSTYEASSVSSARRRSRVAAASRCAYRTSAGST